MKIYNSNIYGNHNVQNISNAKEANAVQSKKTHKDFAVPEPNAAKKITESANATEELKKVLSTEEKRLFEQLFPAIGAASIGVPVKAYKLQQNHNEHIARTGEKILGNRLDIKA